MIEVARLVGTGALGEIMHLEANFSHDKLAQVPATDRRASTRDSPAAGMTATGIHLTDAFVHLLGPAREVLAMTSNRVRQIRFENGATVTLAAAPVAATAKRAVRSDCGWSAFVRCAVHAGELRRLAVR